MPLPCRVRLRFTGVFHLKAVSFSNVGLTCLAGATAMLADIPRDYRVIDLDDVIACR